MLRPILFKNLYSNRLPVFVFRRSLQHKSVTKKGYTNIRKGNDISTANYYFENGKKIKNRKRILSLLISQHLFFLGLRKVVPYFFSFEFYAKIRMRGLTVLDIFLREYRGRTERYYVS